MRHSWRLYAPFMALACAPMLARCSGDDASACDACVDVTDAPLTVAITPDEIWVHPNDVPAIAVALARGPGGDGDVAVTIETDAGFTADSLTIAADKSAGTLLLHVAPSFTQGQVKLVIDAASAGALAQTTLIVHVAGTSGTLDTSFGAGGIADLDPGTGQDFARAMIALQSGVLVGATHVEAASVMEVLRLTASGAIDSSFATTTAPGELGSLALLPSGRIYAVGDVRAPKASFAAVRILAGGGLDPTYAITSDFSLGDDLAFAGAIEPGGRLVAAGSSGDAGAIALARYTQVPLVVDAGADAADADASDAAADGTTDAPSDAASDALDADASANTAHLDPTFGEGGAAIMPLDPATGARALLVANDGSLFALGFASSDVDVVALHFGTDGSLDTTFGDAGVARAFGTSGAVAAILEPSGAIVVATHGSVTRLSSAGAFSQTIATLPSGAGATSIARDPASGAFYVGGFAGTPHACFVTRLTSALAVDATFANAGTLAWTPSGADGCDVAAVAVDDDGRLLTLASITTAGATHMAVSRYWQ